MSAIAGIIHWDGRPVEKAHIDGMLGIVRHRGPDGLHSEVAGPAGFGEARFALRRVEPNQRPQPIWLPDRSCAIVADARLYNRDNLLRTLGKTSWFRDDPSDAEIILAGYEKWGEGCFLKLDGDFVFAIWEPAKKRLLAARDPFGAKPLFFHHDEHRFAFGTEAKQLLILPGVPVEADDQTVGEFLFNPYLALDRSFFRSIHRLPPAHHFAATAQGVAR